MPEKRTDCPDCDLDRRSFVKAVGAAAVGAATVPAVMQPRAAQAAPAASATTAVKRFYESLSEKQLAEIHLPFEHPKRRRISANWHVTDPIIGDDFYSDDQRAIIHDILRGITNEDGYQQLLTQMDEDAGGLEEYSVAVFGNPLDGKFEWELTGRHLTLRADGDSVDKTAFGGPLVYGHGVETPEDNLFYHQTQQVNEVFQALDGRQAEQALVKRAPKENAVQIQGAAGKFSGIQVGDLSSDQQELVEVTLKKLLAPYRAEDVAEVFQILKAGGGLEKLHMAFYQQGDLENDQVWDIWRVEGPSFVWHFRGAPHVHAYINISELVATG